MAGFISPKSGCLKFVCLTVSGPSANSRELGTSKTVVTGVRSLSLVVWILLYRYLHPSTDNRIAHSWVAKVSYVG